MKKIIVAALALVPFLAASSAHAIEVKGSNGKFHQVKVNGFAQPRAVVLGKGPIKVKGPFQPRAIEVGKNGTQHPIKVKGPFQPRIETVE